MTNQKQIKHILVVDDDQGHLLLLKKRLTDAGYDVLTSAEASEGLQYAMDKDPDLIILDVMMPIINGYNFCKLLKSEEKKKQIPIILLTSRDNPDDINIGLKMGANAYLTKPVNFELLLSTIKKVSG
jgi:DNA-binding response OmpR family regulator